MTKPADIETCETCIYRVLRPDGRGFCYRYPKQIASFESNTPRKDDYPQVKPDDWCGEWEGNAPTK